MQSSKPKPQVIWGCVCQEHILVLGKGFLHLPEAAGLELQGSHQDTPAILTHKIKSHGLTGDPFHPFGKESPSPPFGKGFLTSTLQTWKAHWIHCNGADLPRTLPTQPHSYTQTSPSSKYRSPLIHCNSLYKKGFK